MKPRILKLILLIGEMVWDVALDNTNVSFSKKEKLRRELETLKEEIERIPE